MEDKIKGGKAKDLVKLFDKAMASPDVPKLYANGFVTGFSSADTTILLQQNGVSVAALNLSFTTAKSLALKLGGLIKDIESQTGNTIMTTEDVDASFGRIEKKAQKKK